VTRLHDADEVHGDLRPTNILEVVSEEGSPALFTMRFMSHLSRQRILGTPRCMLIDFDWAGKENIAKYPHLLNSHVDWPTGVRGGARLRKEHDLTWVQRLGPRHGVRAYSTQVRLATRLSSVARCARWLLK
jgi:hypothetical protein